VKYQVTVKPGSSQEKIVPTANDALVVYLRAKPHDGEANTALIKLLAKHFHLAKSKIIILRGSKSRTKIVEILDS
jgi:uncharacterized protein (TIGR00251 family)